MKNSERDLHAARETGAMQSFLSPPDKPYPMVATADIGRIAADALRARGRPVIGIEGPRRYSQLDVAALLGTILGQKVTALSVPRSRWEALFRSQGSEHPEARLAMLDGFNTGWINFQYPAQERPRGPTELGTVLRALAAKR